MAQANPPKPESSQNLNVNEEYSKTLQTKSYADTYSLVQHHDVDNDGHITSDLISSGHFEKATSESSSLLHDFFGTTMKSCASCFSPLSSIEQARSDHGSIHGLLLKVSLSSSTCSSTTFYQLSSCLDLDNPLSAQTLSHFHHNHSLYPPLIHRLTSTQHKLARRLELIRTIKTTAGAALVFVVGTAMVVRVVIALHEEEAAAAIGTTPMVVVRSNAWWSSCVMSRRRLEKGRTRVEGEVGAAGEGGDEGVGGGGGDGHFVKQVVGEGKLVGRGLKWVKLSLRSHVIVT